MRLNEPKHSNSVFAFNYYFLFGYNLSHNSAKYANYFCRCVELNPANYTVWQYRRALLKALKIDLNKEFDYIAEVIEDNPKNYQVWHHRRTLVEWTNDASRELDFTAQMLDEESKNYHAWQHRHWVVETFGLFRTQELDFSAALMLEDMRNNSA
ncbi:unnamed protein product, partial [Gongylonema pulchrum]|uniref:Protein farnesyltransferase/geranylgeranyltransferase type-1 subunit alpha n=1 Tax=Gongylonema pulchrum TaxID=637853 RepID=A0A183EQ87_9BILA